MMMPPEHSGAYEAAFANLHKKFVLRLQDNIVSIDLALAEHTMTPKTLNDIMHIAHGLSGGGTIFGFPAVTEDGKAVDRFLTEWHQANPGLSQMSADDQQKLRSLVQQLRKTCDLSVQQDLSPKVPKITLPQRRNVLGKMQEFSVLIVDDDKESSEFIALKLQQGGLRVHTVHDGRSALVMLGRSMPDLVVLDISMPGMNGHEVLNAIKSNPVLANIPVLVLTARTEREHRVGALRGGAIDYIVKPVDTNVLISRINKLLNAGKLTVLIADNDLATLELLSENFSSHGIKVMTCINGKEAWNQIFRFLPDLVILDRMMPGLEGLAVLKKMRSEDSTKYIPVIVLSARGSPIEIEHGRKTGAQDYIVKPFDVRDVINRTLSILHHQDTEI